MPFRGGLYWKGDSEIFSLYSHIFLRKISKLLPKNLMKLTFEMKLFEYIAYNPSNYSGYGLDMKFEGRKQVFSIRLPCVFGVFSGLLQIFRFRIAKNIALHAIDKKLCELL